MQASLSGAVLCASLLFFPALACKPKPAAQSPENPDITALVAQRCPEIEIGDELVDANNARVFVEVVALSGSVPNPIGNWLEEHAVTVRSNANLVAFPNVPTSMPWGQCIDAVCKSSQRTLTITSQLPARGSDPIELAVRIEDSVPEGQAPGKVLLETTLHTPSQQPVVLPANPALSSGSLIVTPYLLRQIDDLHRVLECKARQAEREKQLQ
jgi:hypothetical protein